MVKSIAIILSFVMLYSCASTRNKVILGPFSDILYDASFASEEENSYVNFKLGTMPSIKLAEAIWSLKRNDTEILTTLIKGYTAYAFLVNETDYISDKFKEVEDSKEKTEAVNNYTQAIKYAMVYLDVKGLKFDELVKASKNQGGVNEYLDGQLGDSLRDLEAMMYFAQAMSGLINLNKDDMKLVVYASVAKEIYDWVCKKKPDMNLGACGIYYGAYESSRPAMLGGNPQLGKEIFQKTINKYPDNWLARVMFIEHYLIPNADKEGYKSQKSFLIGAREKLEIDKKWNPVSTGANTSLGDKKYRIYQMIAVEKFNKIEKFEKELF